MINLKASPKTVVEIYTDGACLGNPGNGGFGAVLLYKEHRKEISGSESNTTNNRMELRAAIEALRLLKKPTEVKIYTDSKYVMDGISKWIANWKKNGWKGANKKPIKNIDLWQELDLEVTKHQTTWIWVKGHDGNYYNEVADQLAGNAAKSI
ncbi:MAG: ribonuclease HI [Rickettsiales bacterium]|nr:ribonuclease HI [Rickettsiales bacterium]